MIFIKNKKNIFIVITFLCIAFLGLQNLNSEKRKITNIEYYTIGNDLLVPDDMLTLDSGKIYECRFGNSFYYKALLDNFIIINT